MRWKAILLCCLLGINPGSSASAPGATRRSQAAQDDRGVPDVQIEMKNVRLHVADGLILGVRSLRGVMTSRSGRPPVFDDQRSYILNVLTADIEMDMASLQTLLNGHVMAYEGAPLKNVEVRAERDRLIMKGKLHKGLDVPFSTTATVGVTADGNLRLHAESLKAAGVPAKGLMKLFGLELDDLIDLKRRRGIDVQDNDIVIAPGQVLPPPEIRGRLTRVAVAGDRLVQTFGGSERPRRLVPPEPGARNYIYFGSGTIRFGKLTMSDADLQLIDADPRDPFEFDPARYNAQLVAGYSKSTPQKGLKTFMPDINDLGRTKRVAAR